MNNTRTMKQRARALRSSCNLYVLRLSSQINEADMNQPVVKQTSSHHETSDTYAGVIAQLCPRHRVVVCKDAIQWILQKRKKGGAERSWRGVGYFRTREALVRVSASLCGRIDPAAMAVLVALPAQFGGGL